MGGRAIILVGVSSVGKTSTAEALQRRLPSPWLHVGIDHFFSMFPYEWAGHPRQPGQPGFWVEETTDPDGSPRARIHHGPEGERLLGAFRTCVNALLAEGHDVIVDEMPIANWVVPAWRRDLVANKAFWVHLTAPLPVAEERERGRTRGQVLGNARGHVGLAPADGWDLTLPVERLTPDEAAAAIVDACPFL